MATCPICKSQVPALDKVGHADGFDCPQHGKFKISTTVQATRRNASREQWEAALKRTRELQPKEWAPVIVDTIFER